MRELQSIIGFLQFACSVIMPGRAFLRRLINLLVGKKSPNCFITLNKAARLDIQAWFHFLESYNYKTFFLEDRWQNSDSLCLFTDAATTCGYGALFGHEWFNGDWPDSWKTAHITILELFPIVAAVETWGERLANKCVLFFTDNEAVSYIINKQTSSDSKIMVLVRIMVMSCLRWNILFKAKHIPGKFNILADKISRFQIPQARILAPFLNGEATEIPSHILPQNFQLC